MAPEEAHAVLKNAIFEPCLVQLLALFGFKDDSKIKMQRPISRGDCPSAEGGLHMAPPGFRILTNLAKTPLQSGLTASFLSLFLDF